MLNSRGDTLLPINTKVRLRNFTFEANGRGRSPVGTMIGCDNSAYTDFTDYYIVESGDVQGYAHYTSVTEVLPRRPKKRIITDPPTLDQVVQQLGHGDVTEVNVKSDLVQGIHEVSFKVETKHIFPELLLGFLDNSSNEEDGHE